MAEDKRFIPYSGSESVVLRALRALKIEGNLRLVGETGAGKSTLIHTLEAAADPKSPDRAGIRAEYPGIDWGELNDLPWHFYEASLTADTTRWDLIATQTLIKGSTEISLGPLAEWLADNTPKVRKVCFLDEWNYAAPGITSTMNQLADFRRSVYVSELAILDRALGVKEKERMGVRFRSEDHWLIVAENPYDPQSYSGTNPPNVAQLGRYVPVYVPYMTTSQEVDLLVSHSGIKKTDALRLVQWGEAIRQRFRAREVRMTLSPRNTLYLARLFADSSSSKSGAWELVTSTIEDWFPEEDKPTIRDIVTKGS